MAHVPDDPEIAAQLRRLLDPIETPTGLVDIVREQLHGHVTRNARRRVPHKLGVAALSVAVTAGFALALYAGLGLRHGTQLHTTTDTTLHSLTGGPPASPAPTATQSFLWFTGPSLQQLPSSSAQRVTGTVFGVMDWTGQLRYHFELPVTPHGPNDVQSISADGTRALLLDGTVLDETGTRVGMIPGLASTPMASDARWLSDDSGLCVAVSNEPVAPPQPAQSGGTPSPPPYTLPGADHSVTLKIFGLNGQAQSVATVGGGSLGEPSGIQPDTTSVLSCNRANDVAVVARYHDGSDDTAGNEQTATNQTVSIWAIRLSTGAVLFHQPETRMALGRPFFFGSEDGRLAVEFLWNSEVAGAELDRVIHIPSGLAVPVIDSEPAPDTPGLSADGSRILRRVVYPDTSHTALELLDAATGNVIRRVVFPGILGATAVAEPDSSSFMVQVNGQLVLIDGQGGITELHPPAGIAFPWRPGAQG